MSGQFWKCNNDETLGNLMRFLADMMPEKGWRVEFREWSEKRSLSANGLYWMWLETLAKHFSRGGNSFSKDDMHDLMRHQHLGYVEKKVGKTDLKPQLASTSILTTAQMCHYMAKVDAWAADHGCLLPRPEDNEYSKYREAQ